MVKINDMPKFIIRKESIGVSSLKVILSPKLRASIQRELSRSYTPSKKH